LHANDISPSAILKALLPAQAIAVETNSIIPVECLLPGEVDYISRAVPKRINEFTAGRSCARVALAGLGIPEFALHLGMHREPVWPPSITGSITHTGGYCGVAAAKKTHIQSLGIDVGRRDALRRDLWDQIITPSEYGYLANLPAPSANDMASLIFSAKEAFYKCQYQLTKQWVDFSSVTVRIEASSFSIEPCRALKLETLVPPPWEGRFALVSDFIFTGIGLLPRARMNVPSR
jgi:4'-phosphopantetheinyl transferase EntD